MGKKSLNTIFQLDVIQFPKCIVNLIDFFFLFFFYQFETFTNLFLTLSITILSTLPIICLEVMFKDLLYFSHLDQNCRTNLICKNKVI